VGLIHLCSSEYSLFVRLEYSEIYNALTLSETSLLQMAETEERKLRLSQDDLARKILSTKASAENPSGKCVCICVCIVN
jgi:hypothetical protein